MLTFEKVKKLQKSIKENEASTRVPAGTGFVPQLQDGKGSRMTADMAGTRSCLPRRERTSPAWDARGLIPPKRVPARPGVGRCKDGPRPVLQRSWAEGRGVATACLPRACLPRVPGGPVSLGVSVWLG